METSPDEQTWETGACSKSPPHHLEQKTNTCGQALYVNHYDFQHLNMHLQRHHKSDDTSEPSKNEVLACPSHSATAPRRVRSRAGRSGRGSPSTSRRGRGGGARLRGAGRRRPRRLSRARGGRRPSGRGRASRRELLQTGCNRHREVGVRNSAEHTGHDTRVIGLGTSNGLHAVCCVGRDVAFGVHRAAHS